MFTLRVLIARRSRRSVHWIRWTLTGDPQPGPVTVRTGTPGGRTGGITRAVRSSWRSAAPRPAGSPRQTWGAGQCSGTSPERSGRQRSGHWGSGCWSQVTVCRALWYPSPGYRAGSGVMLLEMSDLWSLGDCTTGHQGTERWGQVTGKGQWGQVSGVRFWRTALQSTSLGGVGEVGLFACRSQACMHASH